MLNKKLYKKLSFLTLTIIILLQGLTPNLSCAQEMNEGDNPTTEKTISTKNEDLSYIEEKFLHNISHAQLAIHKNQYNDARHLFGETRNLIDNMDFSNTNQMQSNRLRSAVIVYRSGIHHMNYFLPIIKENNHVKYYYNGHPWGNNGKALKITDAKVVYITLKLEKDDLNKRINDIKKSFDALTPDYPNIAKQLDKLEHEIIVDRYVSDDDLQNTYNHLMLTKYLIENKVFPGANFALSHANDALNSLNIRHETPQRVEKIKEVKNELKELNKEINKKTPAITPKMEQKLREWTDEIGNWINKNF